MFFHEACVDVQLQEPDLSPWPLLNAKVEEAPGCTEDRPRPEDDPSNPQQPIHSLRETHQQVTNFKGGFTHMFT